MRINKTVFALDSVYPHLTHYETIVFLNELLNLQKELEEIFINGIVSGYVSDNTKDILSQIDLLNKNIETLETALLCHETKLFEKIKLQNINFNLSLN